MRIAPAQQITIPATFACPSRLCHHTASTLHLKKHKPQNLNCLFTNPLPLACRSHSVYPTLSAWKKRDASWSLHDHEPLPLVGRIGHQKMWAPKEPKDKEQVARGDVYQLLPIFTESTVYPWFFWWVCMRTACCWYAKTMNSFSGNPLPYSDTSCSFSTSMTAI
jgi:hypothetical protein